MVYTCIFKKKDTINLVQSLGGKKGTKSYRQVQASNPNTWEIEARESGGYGHHWLIESQCELGKNLQLKNNLFLPTKKQFR